MNAAMIQFLLELDQCKNGTRGWVGCSKRRATSIGVPHGEILKAATMRGLQVAPHGRYGYIAGRFPGGNTASPVK